MFELERIIGNVDLTTPAQFLLMLILSSVGVKSCPQGFYTAGARNKKKQWHKGD